MSGAAGIEQALSLERFARYIAWAGGDRDQALALYTLNTQLSEALYAPLQALELSLRNRHPRGDECCAWRALVQG